MGDFKLKIDIAKPDVAAAERGLKSIFKELDKIDKKADSVDRKMKRIGGAGTGGKGVVSAKANSKFGQGILSGLGIGTGAAAALTAIRALGGAITAAGASAKRAAVDFAEFQNNIVSISRISGIAESEVASMSQDFLELSSAIPVSSSELQKFAEVASRFGIKGREGVQAFAETFGRLQSIIGPVSEETTKSVARIASLTDFPIEEIDKFANAVVVLGKNFATTEDQIIRTGERLAGDLSQFGVTADEVLGLATAFDALGVKAELGGSAMVRILNSLTKTGLRGGADLKRLSELAGESTESFKKMALISRIDAFSQLIKGGGSATEIMDRLNLSGVRVQGVLGRLISRNDKFSESMAQSNKEMMDNNVLMRDSDRQADTLESRFNRLSNAVTAAFISIGGEGSDANGEMEGLTDTLIGMAEAFSGVESDAAKMFPNMESLGNTFRDLFKDGVKSVGEMLKGFDKMTPAIEGIANSLSTVVSLLGKAANLYGDFNNADIKDYMAGFAEFISFGTYQAEIENIPLDNPEAATLIEIGRGRRNALGGNGTAGEWGVDNGTFGEWEDGTEDIFRDSFKSLDEIANKTIPGMSSQLDKYKDKAADIFFNNSLKGLGAGEKRLKQLQRGFKTRKEELDPTVNEAVALLAQNKEFKFLSDEDLVNLTQLVKKSEEMAENFKDVEAALTADIQIDKIDNAIEELKKLDSAQIDLSNKIKDVTAGPAPDVNAIQNIEQTAAFIADSKRADKEAEFAREQLRMQQEIIDIDRQILLAVKKDAENKLAIANFRNTP